MVRVLHVDDNETDRHLVKRELGRVFPDPQIQVVRDQGEFDLALEAGAFDVAITDYQLGWTNGIAVLNAVKARFPDRPVVMFTGTGNEEVAVAAMKAGLDDYVVKSPSHMIRLVTAVRSALEKAEARRRAAQAERDRAELFRREQLARTEAERLLREAQEADRRKDEFLAILAHELRNPLATISNAVYLLQCRSPLEGGKDDGVSAMLTRQVKHLGRIVDDLLDTTRITRGKLELQCERLDLLRLVRDAVEDHRRAAAGGGLVIELELEGKTVWVRGDRTRLSQVVGNLLHNSIKFTAPGGRVAVRVAVDHVTHQAILAVEDNGIGIDAQLMPRVFEMFTQADQALDRNRGGLGLGLALVKGLIELHGGQVTASSLVNGQGARFTCRLPLDSNVEEPTASVPAPTTAARGCRILVVEDQPDQAESLRLLLALSGHDVRVAHTGQVAIDMAKAFRPEVVLCDLGLPGGMSGFAVASALRQDPTTAQVRLIAVTGYGHPADQAKARAAGFNLHLTKPVDPAELERHLVSG